MLGDGLVAVQINSETIVLSDAVLTVVKDRTPQLSQTGFSSSEAGVSTMEEVKTLIDSGTLRTLPLQRCIKKKRCGQ